MPWPNGQVSIDPLPHIRREPFGMVVLPIITVIISGWPFGFASAPYDRDWANRYPKKAAWMSLAGPAANLALVLLAAGLIRFGVYLDVFYPPSHINFAKITASDLPGVWTAAGYLLGVLYSLNMVLFILNMFPVPPLDGSKALSLLLSPEWDQRWREFIEQPMLSWIGILIAWQLFGEIFMPLFFGSVNLLYPEMNYH